MPRPRYPLERTGGIDGVDRALSGVSLDIDDANAAIAATDAALAAGLAATPYTPSNLVDWSGVSPGNLQAALDRIAAAIGPIP